MKPVPFNPKSIVMTRIRWSWLVAQTNRNSLQTRNHFFFLQTSETFLLEASKLEMKGLPPKSYLTFFAILLLNNDNIKQDDARVSEDHAKKIPPNYRHVSFTINSPFDSLRILMLNRFMRVEFINFCVNFFTHFRKIWEDFQSSFQVNFRFQNLKLTFGCWLYYIILCKSLILITAQSIFNFYIAKN